MVLHFTKIHGLGNDFIAIPWGPAPIPPTLPAALCDRHFGIGADGLLLLLPTPLADIQMIVLNPDGSRPEMCGNGLRCVAHLTALAAVRPPASATVRVLTDAGLFTCLVELSDPDHASVTAEVGVYSDPSSLGLDIDGRDVAVEYVSIGNPHAIVFGPPEPATFDDVAPVIATHPRFPHGANATIATVDEPNHLTLRVWERGVGPTLACGTAACATAAAAVSRGYARSDAPITAHLPGGDLVIYIDPIARTARMRGPSVRVFDGRVNLPSPDDLPRAG